MTIENYHYRNSPLFLRNQFLGDNHWKMPNVPKCTLTAEELGELRLIGYDRAKNGNDEHFQRMVHFFLYDYKFEDIWTAPEKRVEALEKYRAVLTPDFSMYLEMHPVMQLYNTFRNRWVGAYLADQGIKVVPTVNWGDESTFGFCFDGIAKGSAVAVSTYMASEHNNRKDQKDWFLAGYNEMLRRIEPSVIICYYTPFPEMQGNIVHVDYELSSWKHDEDDIGKAAAEPTEGIRIVKRTGHVIFDDFVISKGGGSAVGGEWQPSKADDGRLVGEPGDIINSNARGGYERDTVIGENGRGVVERHYSDHSTPNAHSPIHDHIIGWERGIPDFGKPVNYFDTDVPYLGYIFDLFKTGTNSVASVITKEASTMRYVHREYQFDAEEYRFKTISEFKWSIICGREIGFVYGDKTYGIIRSGDGLEDGPFELYEANNEACLQPFDTLNKLLDAEIDGIRLRNIITQVEVLWRNI